MVASSGYKHHHEAVGEARWQLEQAVKELRAVVHLNAPTSPLVFETISEDIDIIEREVDYLGKIAAIATK